MTQAQDVPAGRLVKVKVPATSANLGPGFDTLGLALAIYDRVEVKASATAGARVEVQGVGEETVARGEENLVVQTISYVFSRVGVTRPGLELVAHNVIPHGRGLGSSGAAIVSGIMAAKGLLAGVVDFSSAELLKIATELEGHPDNVAPALFGGLTIAWMSDTGPEHKKLLVHRGVSPLVLVPEQALSTKVARSLQPDSVPHADAVFNLSRAALLIAALVQSPELLMAATEDRLHQNYRASAMPHTHELVEALRSREFAAVVSGAGPSILVLCDDPTKRMQAAEAAAELGDGRWQALMPAVDLLGAVANVEDA